METKFYTFFIEQILTNGEYSEYSSTTGYASHKAAQVAYFDKMKNVSNAMGNTHQYCLAYICDSFGNKFESNVLGERVMPAPEPEAE